MAPSQEQREVSPFSNPSGQEESPESVHGGEVKPLENNSSPISAPSPATPLTEISKPSQPSTKRKQLHEHEHGHPDSDSEHETIKIRKGHPSERDPTELPIITTNTSGERKILWAKMDTGADFNIIAEKIVQRLGRSSEIQVCPEAQFKVGEIGGNDITIDRKIVLSFWAGKKNRECRDVEFWVPKQESDTDTDGVYDVLLGWKELIKYHMVMTDPEFDNDAEEGLEVLAKSARDESSEDFTQRPRKSICLGVKFSQVKHSGSVRR
jgi:hypothetical protein